MTAYLVHGDVHFLSTFAHFTSYVLCTTAFRFCKVWWLLFLFAGTGTEIQEQSWACSPGHLCQLGAALPITLHTVLTLSF
jgi:hypothetical protein